jgi:divalent metal cation (Fe/Co/Zn/Cd) transporter
MDTALPVDELQRVRQVLDGYANSGVAYHALRTRQSGARRFVSVHILIPNQWSIAQGHELAERVEADIRTTLPGTTVFTHLEPQDDAASFADATLDREDTPPV